MPRLAAPALACLILVATLPATEARAPLPETEGAARGFVTATLAESDADIARLAKRAQRLLARLPLPEAGAPEGELEVRARFTQPGLADRDELLATLWVGARGGAWRGAFWVESDAGVAQPNALQLDDAGSLVMVEGGALAARDAVRLRIHFLGADGARETVDLGDVALLPGAPTLGRVDAGGALATTRGEPPEALFLTPWNLVGEPVEMGFRVVADDGRTLSDWRVGGCDDATLRETEPGCRPLYVVEWPADAARVELWRVDEGTRVVDRALERDALAAGYAFS